MNFYAALQSKPHFVGLSITRKRAVGRKKLQQQNCSCIPNSAVRLCCRANSTDRPRPQCQQADIVEDTANALPDILHRAWNNPTHPGFCWLNQRKGNWRSFMETAAIGWIAAIIIGGIAGWLAEMFMKSNMGIIMNVVLGIVGALVANALLSMFGVVLGGWLGYLIAGFIGACILIAIARMFRRPAV
jgi:uncharacterized membrane protein YeaQ/YmgE (transglycosylase-associated protein family)